jgi:hypothetical protein
VRAVLNQFAQRRLRLHARAAAAGPATPSTNSCTRTRAGFCEHYAGAFVFLMRAAGIPARVVTGYQGGELNPIDGYLTVRQSDAHAWSEVWLPSWAGCGSTRPPRCRRTACSATWRSALPAPAPFGLEGLGRLMQPDPDSLLARVRYAIGAANNGWNQWVLNYTPQRQHALVRKPPPNRIRRGTRAKSSISASGSRSARSSTN